MIEPLDPIENNFMKPEVNNEIWTIGHSTRPLEEFVDMLQAFQIELLADIRSFPGSRKFPQFNKENLAMLRSMLF